MIFILDVEMEALVIIAWGDRIEATFQKAEFNAAQMVGIHINSGLQTPTEP